MKRAAAFLTLLATGCMSMEPKLDRVDPAIPASWPVGSPYLSQSEAALPAVTYQQIFRDPRLQTLIAQQGNHPAYVVVTMAAEGYARLNGLLPSGSIQGLVDALDRSPAFRLVYRRQTAWVFQYVARAGLQGARA